MTWPKHYSLKEEHDKTFEIHDARDGKTFHVDKKSLHPARQIQVMKMQKFKDGGEVEPEFGTPEYQMMLEEKGKTPSSEDDRIKFSDLPKAAASGFINAIFPSNPEATSFEEQKGIAPPAPIAVPSPMLPPPTDPAAQPMTEMPTAGAPAPDQMQPMAMPKGPQNPYDMYAAGVNQESRGQMALNKAVADQYDQSNRAMADIRMRFEQEQQDIKAKRDALAQEVATGKINPNQYWDNMDTASRVQTTIGILLSGLGAGLSRTNQNLALEMINKNIDRDIAAQKDNLGKKESLLSQYQRELGDSAAAEAAAKSHLLAVTQGQIAALSAKLGDPMIAGQAMQKIAALKAQQSQLDGKVAQGRAVQDLLAQANKDPKLLPQTIDAIEAVDPARAKDLRMRLVPGVGLAPTHEGAKAVTDMRTVNQQINNGIQRLREISKMTGKSLSPSIRAEVETIRNTMIGALRLPITGPGAMNEGERKLLERLVPGVADIFSLDSVNRTRLDTLEKRMNDGYASALKANGLAVPQADVPGETKVMGGKKYRKAVINGVSGWVPVGQ